MSYTTRAAITAKLPESFLVEALDDDNDGVEDAGLLDQIITDATVEIDGYLEGRYTLPITPAPALLRTACLTIVLADLYARRGVADEANPWKKPATALRTRLERIAKGEIPLVARVEKADAAVTVVTEPARTHSASGGLLA